MTVWPADKVERRKTDSLVPYARNSRTHSPAQIASIAASIKEWGWTTPVLIDPSGGIIAGHGRVMAAQKLGIDDVPCMVAEGWTEAQRRAYIIADNRLPELAGWDREMLAVEIGELKNVDFDVDLTGFDSQEIDEILASFNATTDGLTDPDDAPEAGERIVTRLGDTWLLGNHRIVCGDSTNSVTVERCLNGVRPHLMVTDPPYGVEYDPTRTSKNAAKSGKVLNDDVADWGGGLVSFPWRRSLRLARISAYGNRPRFSRKSRL